MFQGFRGALAAAQAAAGDLMGARTTLELLASRDFEDFPRDQNLLGALSALTPVCAELADEARAFSLHAALAPFSGQMIAIAHGASCDGAVDQHLGRLATTFGDLDLAEEHFDAALPLLRSAASPLFLAHAQHHCAAMLWKRGGVMDRERARELARDARAAYAALDLDQSRSSEAIEPGSG